MSLEIDAYKRLTKGLRLSPVFSPKNPKSKSKSNKASNKKVTDKKDTSVVKEEKAVSSVAAPKAKKETIAKPSIPADMKPEPIGLSNTSSLPAVNLGGMGTRSKQFKER